MKKIITILLLFTITLVANANEDHKSANSSVLQARYLYTTHFDNIELYCWYKHGGNTKLFAINFVSEQCQALIDLMIMVGDGLRDDKLFENIIKKHTIYYESDPFGEMETFEYVNYIRAYDEYKHRYYKEN